MHARMPQTPSLSRRQLVVGGAALGAAAIGGPYGVPPAGARVPTELRQAPYFYRFRFGDALATVVSDGPPTLEPEPAAAFVGLSRDEIRRQLTDSFLPLDDTLLEQNALIVRTANRTVLFDTGMGMAKDFGPATGRLFTSMREAGIDPEDIDAVVMSHAHIDHCGGNCDERGTPHFPNAQFYLHEADFDFWTDEAKARGVLRSTVEQARRNLLPVRDRIVFLRNEEEFLPGITALAAPGHTIGHTIFYIRSGGAALAYIGDLAVHQVLLLKNPSAHFVFDTDPAQAAETRVRLLTMLAANRTPILSYHFAWPGLGHVARDGDGFRYFPAPMDLADRPPEEDRSGKDPGPP